MTIFKNRHQAKKALLNKPEPMQSKYKILKFQHGFIVACGLLTL